MTRPAAKGSVLLIGGTGQLGASLLPLVSVVAKCRAPDRKSLDLTQIEATRAFLREMRPAVIVNASGYTDVDKAESDSRQCYALNSDGPAVLAEEARSLGSLLIHYSTDYVFSGSQRTPYTEEDTVEPLSIYGASKLAGEGAVRSLAGPHLVFRTSWLYSPRRRNFLLTTLRLARERTELRVVDDQVGCPTSTDFVAAATRSAVMQWLTGEIVQDSYGVYHVASTGQATWCTFAREILKLDPRRDQQAAKTVVAIETKDYPTAAMRPPYSVLDTTKFARRFGLPATRWDEQLAGVMSQLEFGAQ